jgi:hypothetical protein
MRTAAWGERDILSVGKSFRMVWAGRIFYYKLFVVVVVVIWVIISVDHAHLRFYNS